MSSASPPPTAPRPGELITAMVAGSPRDCRVRDVEWHPHVNDLDASRIPVLVDGTEWVITHADVRG